MAMVMLFLRQTTGKTERYTHFCMSLKPVFTRDCGNGVHFIDEPTSGLDPTGAVLFRKIIEEERRKGTTIFLTTHNMLDAELLCDRVAFITNGNIVALDTPKRLKEQNSSHRIVTTYLYQGRREEKTIEIPELEAGIPFPHDEIISIHSEEPTLEDMFIQYTGRGLS